MEKLARKCGIHPDRLEAWELGTQSLTFNQAMTFADKSHVPFGYLFADAPPEEQLPIPDLRTVEGKAIPRPSAELMDLLKIMLQRQEWYREYLQQQLASPVNFTGRYNADSQPRAIVQDMRNQLNIVWPISRGTWEDYYRDLVKRIESIGVLVMRSPYLIHHTRPFNVDEFRGFAISDAYAPLIFVNHADTPGARLFTLIHELCHIWIGASGISDGSTSTQRKDETLCNAVAAEFLVPEDAFMEKWDDTFADWRMNLQPLEAYFHVSSWVLARRALTLQLISQSDYADFIYQQKKIYELREKKDTPISYFRTRNAQISPSFSRAVVSEALSGQLLLRDAGDLLDGMKPAGIAKFARELGL